ncbi:addiction module antidote protein, HigA family [Xenorhabdus hominickii]|uniref:Addiction module antidote protein, HigA family n=2 Tax=Xenorhabdus hominickii TaxID=351679 RepID=A0A2G0Q6E8_XENHO|nr:addiction module antidote protein, HigA family [Xenorhabdus hominickii]PHM54771.1 virulence-associated protein A [Xenorhabdus hominickii]
MRNTKRRPATVGEILISEFLEPLGIEINVLADAMGVHRNSLSRLIHDKGTLTAPMAIKLGATLGNTAEFWLNIQHAVEVWDVRHQESEMNTKDIKRLI